MGDMNQDPSMEEILASIKRVIADDGRTAPAPGGRARGSASKRAPEAEAEQAPAPVPEPFEAAVDPQDDVLELSEPLREDATLVSANVTASARQSLAALAAARPKSFEPQAYPGDGPLETVVREMLRPMLKDWLDTRLPEMVEDMVAKEIARITGKRL
jgi:cell pole-organizing protein PopZ